MSGGGVRARYYFFFNCVIEFNSEAYEPGGVFFRKVNYVFHLFNIHGIVHILKFLSVSVSESCISPGVCTFPLSCQVYWHTLVHNILISI